MDNLCLTVLVTENPKIKTQSDSALWWGLCSACNIMQCFWISWGCCCVFIWKTRQEDAAWNHSQKVLEAKRGQYFWLNCPLRNWTHNTLLALKFIHLNLGMQILKPYPFLIKSGMSQPVICFVIVNHNKQVANHPQSLLSIRTFSFQGL